MNLLDIFVVAKAGRRRVHSRPLFASLDRFTSHPVSLHCVSNCPICLSTTHVDAPETSPAVSCRWMSCNISFKLFPSPPAAQVHDNRMCKKFNSIPNIWETVGSECVGPGLTRKKENRPILILYCYCYFGGSRLYTMCTFLYVNHYKLLKS